MKRIQLGIINSWNILLNITRSNSADKIEVVLSSTGETVTMTGHFF